MITNKRWRAHNCLSMYVNIHILEFSSLDIVMYMQMYTHNYVKKKKANISIKIMINFKVRWTYYKWKNKVLKMDALPFATPPYLLIPCCTTTIIIVTTTTMVGHRRRPSWSNVVVDHHGHLHYCHRPLVCPSWVQTSLEP